MPKHSYNKKERQLNNICHQSKQATIFDLKGVIIISEFEKATKTILNKDSSDHEIKVALETFNRKNPSKDWFDKNKKVTLRIGELSRSENTHKYSESVRLKALELKKNWKKHYKSLDRIKNEYNKLREQGKKMMSDKLKDVKEQGLGSILTFHFFIRFVTDQLFL